MPAMTSTTESGKQKLLNKNQDTTIMKVKYLLVALLTLTFFGCDENTGSLGLGIFPDGDQNLNGRSAKFSVTTESTLSGAVYAKTSIGYVGKFSDPMFGFYECSFLAQLYCPEGITFPSVYNKDTNPKGIMAGDSIHTAELVLYYSKYFGDSLNACRMSVYELNTDLNVKDFNYYTDIKAEEYKGDFLARKAYTAVDLSLSDSIRNDEDFVPYVRLTSDKIKELGEKIYTTSKQQGSLDFESFKKILKGIYVKSDYGDGTILYVDQINLNVAFRVHATDSLGNVIQKKNGQDSLYYTTRTFATTREVIQANQITNDKDLLQDKVDEAEHTYLKTPAGIFTRANLPLNKIAEELKNDTISGVKLTFTSYNQPIVDAFSMKAPTTILLLREKDKDTFFEDNKLSDNITSYITTQEYKSGLNQYIFPNLARLVKTCLTEKEEAKKKAGADWDEAKWEADNKEWNKVLLIPVTIQYDNSSNSSKNIISVRHDLQPSYVKLKGGAKGETDEKFQLDLEVTYVNFSGKQ